MENALEKLNALFEELVPDEGAAETKAGELVRAVSRIGYRFYNDGDKIGVDYGNETCNAAARYIMNVFKDQEFAWTVNGMWGLVSDKFYEKGFGLLIEQVVSYIESNPELRERRMTVTMMMTTTQKRTMSGSLRKRKKIMSRWLYMILSQHGRGDKDA